MFTAVTMTISVATWTFSALKFQADMGILLCFMFLVNMFGAILLLPALAAYLVGDRKTPGQGEGCVETQDRASTARSVVWSVGTGPGGCRVRTAQRVRRSWMSWSRRSMNLRSFSLTSSPPMPITSPSRAARATRVASDSTNSP